MDKPILDAIAKIEVGGSRGTGFVVGSGLVLTAMHVVGNRRERTIYPGPYELTFPGGKATATIHGKHWAPVADWALLQCDDIPSGVRPLRLAELDSSEGIWDTFGFPEANPYGMVQRGTVRNRHATLQGADAYQLYSEEAAAGNGAPVSGLSGGPVVVEGHVVGLMRFALMKDTQAVAGTLYACPAALVVEGCGGLLETVPLHTDPFSQLKTVCCSIPGRGTGYVVDENRITTSARAVEGLDEVSVVLRGTEHRASVEIRDTDSDCAILAVTRPLAGAQPLPPAECGRGMVSWHGYGFASGEGIPLTGEVMDPGAITLSLPGLDVSPAFDELRGTPVLMDGAIVGHFNRLKPVGGLIAATPTRAVQDLLARTRDLPQGDSPGEPRPLTVVEPPKVAPPDEILAAIAAGEQRLMTLWQRWRDTDLPTSSAALPVAQALVDFGRPQKALDVLAEAEEGTRTEQLRALALSKLDRDDEAIEILVRLRAADALDVETGGLLAGRSKRLWQKTGRRAYLQQSYDVYWETFERSGDSYPGINAAAMALHLGDRSTCEKVARQVLHQLERVPVDEMDLWLLATLAEAHLLAGELADARTWYGRAAAKNPNALSSIAVMRRQARRNLGALGRPEDAVDDILEVPAIIAFTGHMVDQPDRPTPRFPPARVGPVRQAIRMRLDTLDARYGFSSAANGGDILFLEELLERGGSAHVLLPFPKADFQQTSVGDDWAHRYARILDNERVEVTELADTLPPEGEQPDAYMRCSLELHRRATEMARPLDEKPTLLTVWNGDPGDGPGGTADAVRAWEQSGNPVEHIDISRL